MATKRLKVLNWLSINNVPDTFNFFDRYQRREALSHYNPHAQGQNKTEKNSCKPCRQPHPAHDPAPSWTAYDLPPCPVVLIPLPEDYIKIWCQSNDNLCLCTVAGIECFNIFF